MNTCRHRRTLAGFTLIELITVIVVAGVLITLAAPSLRDFILVQRLKGINAELLTDLQYARSEAVSRGQAVNVHVKSATADKPLSCYILFTDPASLPSAACDCQLPAGSRCSSPSAREIRTVLIPADQGITLSTPAGQPAFVAFDPVNGSILTAVSNAIRGDRFVLSASIDSRRTIQTTLSKAGRAAVCAPSDSALGVPAC
jgi:type IV fimbrial biogenesis protein FimT